MVGARCVVAFGHLVYIKGKLHPQVHGWIVRISYYRAIFLCQLGIHERDRWIGRERVTRTIGSVVRQRAQGKCVFIQVFGLTEESEDEIAAPDIMCQVAEEFAAKMVIAHVLDNR